MPEFEWDEAKRLTNLSKHKFDFLDARRLFDGRPVFVQQILRRAEIRIGTTGEVDGTLVTAIWTIRMNKIRLISVRRARDEEKWNHRQLHG